MHLYHAKTAAALEPEIGTLPIHYVGLGAHEFQFAFGNLVSIRNMLRVDFGLRHAEYTWESGPCAIPVWLLIDQVPSEVMLESSTALRFNLASGDWLRLHTDEGPYESQVFEWRPAKGGASLIDIY